MNEGGFCRPLNHSMQLVPISLARLNPASATRSPCDPEPVHASCLSPLTCEVGARGDPPGLAPVGVQGCMLPSSSSSSSC